MQWALMGGFGVAHAVGLSASSAVDGWDLGLVGQLLQESSGANSLALEALLLIH